MATTPTLSILASDAEIAGHKAGLAVLAGKLAVEAVGAQWVKWADRSYGQGRAFERAFDATGAQR